MEPASDPAQAFASFARSIRGALAAVGPFVAEHESASAVQVERGIVLAHVLNAPNKLPPPEALESVEPLIQLASTTSLSRVAVVDAAGNHRPVYRPMLIYSWLVSFSLLYEMLPRRDHGRWEESLRTWCDLMESDLGDAMWTGDRLTASGAPAAAEAAWIALALHVAGRIFIRDVWLDLASDLFGRLTRTQQPDGSFIVRAADDSAPALLECEPMILHAAADYALAAKDRGVAAVVRRNADFVASRIKPRGAAQEPWALFAMIWNPATRPLADAMLRAPPVAGAPVTNLNLILLSEALYSLAAFGIDRP
jgi:hypothetical protein